MQISAPATAAEDTDWSLEDPVIGRDISSLRLLCPPDYFPLTPFPLPALPVWDSSNL